MNKSFILPCNVQDTQLLMIKLKQKIQYLLIYNEKDNIAEMRKRKHYLKAS